MHDFTYKKNILHGEGVSVPRIAAEVGTPFYLYSHKTITDHFQKLKDAFASVDPLICYSVKANSNIAVIRSLVNRGAGLDIVSGGELFRARIAGADPRTIVYAGVGKTADEIDAALQDDILLFNAESLNELELLDARAKELGKRPRIALRINPNIEAKTHKYITTGKQDKKFGIDFNTARWVFANSNRFLHLKIRGVHIHIGSQIVESGPFAQAIKKTRDFISALKNNGARIEYFNIGGGLGIIYHQERPQTADEYARVVLPIIRGCGLKIILEPGRFIVGNAGILVTRVTYVKRTKTKTFIIVDAGMNDLVRPTLYEAYHEIVPVVKKTRVAKTSRACDIVGPICESGDFFALGRRVDVPAQGDLLAVMSAGAYGFSMSSNYNSRLRACEVMVRDKHFSSIRERETYADLIKGEVMPRIIR
ncbi:MAG: diaminopimelate decarboxylase [Candidatus Omnitrophota bacterium]